MAKKAVSYLKSRQGMIMPSIIIVVYNSTSSMTISPGYNTLVVIINHRSGVLLDTHPGGLLLGPHWFNRARICVR